MISPQLNPVGWSYTESDRKWLVEFCIKHDINVISDEVYSGADKNWKPFFEEGKNFITISSLTKVHGLGVIRYGWICADRSIKVLRASGLAVRTIILSAAAKDLRG